MGLEADRLAAKQINAPETVFSVTNDGQPRRPCAAARFGVVVFFQHHPSDKILIDLNTEGIGDLLSDPRASKARITLLQLDDGADQLLGGTLGTGVSTARGACTADDTCVERVLRGIGAV